MFKGQFNQSMRVLYLSYDGMTDPLGQSQVIPYLRGLSSKGHIITLISFEKKDHYKKLSSEIKNLLDHSGIRWVPLRYTKKPPVLSTVYDVLRMRSKAFSIARKEKTEIIHCRSQLTALIGLQLKKRLGTKLIFDMRGFWADERIDGNIWSLSNPIFRIIYRFFKRNEKRLLIESDQIISLTENAADYLQQLKLKENSLLPITIIPCCVDLELFSEKNIDTEKKNELRKATGASDHSFILLYLGAIGTWYLLDEMLDFFSCLLKQKPDSLFLFITPESGKTIFEKAAGKKIPVEKIIVRSSERTEVPAWISVADASIFFIKPAFSKKASSPTKQGEIMAMGVPVICNRGIGDTDRIIRVAKAGWIVSEFTDKNYSSVIDQLDSKSQDDKAQIVHAAAEFFSLEKGVEKYDSVYKKLFKEITHGDKIHS